MSNSGYWKHQGAQRKFEADKHTHKIKRILTSNGWTFIRDSTKDEDRKDKWDALWLDEFAKEQRVDYKTGNGVQNSHKKQWDQGELKVTRYAMYNKHSEKLKVIDVRDFWGSNPTRHVNPEKQVYWVKQ